MTPGAWHSDSYSRVSVPTVRSAQNFSSQTKQTKRGGGGVGTEPKTILGLGLQAVGFAGFLDCSYWGHWCALSRPLEPLISPVGI